MNNFNSRFAICVLILATFVCSGAFADQPAAPADSTDVINAQMDVTQAEVSQVIQDLYARKPDNQFHIADYRENSEKFNRKIETGLMLFEFQLSHSVMTKEIKPLMDRYNSIYRSTQFSDDQKKVILSQQLVTIESKLGVIDMEYQNDILQVYALGGNLPYDYQRTEYFSGDRCTGVDGLNHDTLPESVRNQFNLKHPWSGCEKYNIYQPVRFITGADTVAKQEIDDFGKLELGYQERAWPISTTRYAFDGSEVYVNDDDGTISGVEWLMDYMGNGELFNQMLPQLFATEVYPVVSQGCSSQLCVDLQTADIGHFLKLVKTDIDRTIPITLMDGTKLQLNGLNLNLKVVQKFLSQTNYPKQMPFDTP